MAGSNEFLPFATGVGANVMTQAAYNALAARPTGFPGGQAESDQCNKVWRQSAFIAAAMGQIVANANIDAVDDGNVANFVTNFLTALQRLLVITPPPGVICYYADDTLPPPGRWLPSDGQVLARAGTYAGLFAIIGTTYNTGGESGAQFRLPDLRGVFIRGVDALRGLDPGRAMGSFQGDQNKAHDHDMTFAAASEASSGYTNHNGFVVPDADILIDAAYHNTAGVIDSSGGTEVRVKNIAMRGFISY